MGSATDLSHGELLRPRCWMVSQSRQFARSEPHTRPERSYGLLLLAGCFSPEQFQEVEGYSAWISDGYVNSVAMDTDRQFGASVDITDVVGTEYTIRIERLPPQRGSQDVTFVQGHRLDETDGGCESRPPGSLSRMWLGHSGMVEIQLDQPEPDTTSITVTLTELVLYDVETPPTCWRLGRSRGRLRWSHPPARTVVWMLGGDPTRTFPRTLVT